MKVVNFSIEIPLVSFRDTILSEMNAYKNKKESDEKQRGVMVQKLFKMADELKIALNEAIGENIWVLDNRSHIGHKSHFKGNKIIYVELHFTPIYINKGSHTYSVKIGVPYEEVYKVGQSFPDYYRVVEGGDVQIWYNDISNARTLKDEDETIIKITDLNKIHELSKIGYVQFLEKKLN